MACTYKYRNSELGDIEVLEKSNSRGMSVRVFETGTIRVTAPRCTPTQEIDKYVVSLSEWIKKSLEKISHRARKTTVFGEDTTFRTRNHELRLRPDSKDSHIHLSVKQGVISVSYPPGIIPEKNEQIQKLTRRGIAFALKVEGTKYLTQRLKDLAEDNGFRFRSVVLKDLKSRWGSCSAQGDICLNVQLMRLPDHLIDHVLLHELCHTKEMNHGPKFHQLLDRVDGGRSAKNSNELKRWSTQIY